jgi:putative oxidoreductase
MGNSTDFMKVISENAWLELALRWLMGLLFLYSGIEKISAPAQFAKIIYGYALFPDISINLIAIVIPFLEAVSGGALVLGIYPRSAAAIIDGLLFAFLISISINLARGHVFDCGCFSLTPSEAPLSAWFLLGRDLFLFLLGLVVFFFRGERRKWCGVSR